MGVLFIIQHSFYALADGVVLTGKTYPDDACLGFVVVIRRHWVRRHAKFLGEPEAEVAVALLADVRKIHQLEPRAFRRCKLVLATSQ